MKRIAVIALAAFGIGLLMTSYFSYRPTAAIIDPEENVETVQSPRYFVSPFRMIPFVSQKTSRKNICALKIDGPIETICNRKFNKVRPEDTQKIDELFEILREVNEDAAPTEQAKYLTSQLIFSTLPRGAAKKAASALSAQMLASLITPRTLAQAPVPSPTSISRSDYINQMQAEYDRIKGNCPQPPNENWVFSAMCSEYSWINNERQPIYSRQYAEYGGPCRSDAGAIEATQVENSVNTKMRTEYDFVDEKGVSTQIACSFSCNSYRCPMFEQDEVERTQCENPIYYPFYNRRSVNEITAKDKTAAFAEAKSDCFDRGFDYVTRPDGTSELKKVRSCKLTFFGDTTHFDPVLKREVPARSFCCSCDRPERDPYVSVYDFSEPGANKDDWFKRIYEAFWDREDEDAADDDVKEDSVLRFRFKCSITSEWGNGSVKIKEVRRSGGADPVDKNGNLVYATPVGVSGAMGATSASCDGEGTKVPVCVDPRTGAVSQESFDFVHEVADWQGREQEVKAEFDRMFYEMIGSKRACRQDEMPRG